MLTKLLLVKLCACCRGLRTLNYGPRDKAAIGCRERVGGMREGVRKGDETRELQVLSADLKADRVARSVDDHSS